MQATSSEGSEQQPDADGQANHQRPLAREPVQQPQRRDRARRHRYSEEALEAVHPAAGLRKPGSKRRHERDHHERQCQSKPERSEHRDRACQRKKQRRSERRAEERSGARRRDECSKRPGAEAARRLGCAAEHRQLEQPEQIGGDRDRQQQQQHDGARVL